MAEILTELQEARAHLDAVRSAIADPLKRWSDEPHRRELVPEVAAALSELIRSEAVYQRVLEQVVLELVEKVVGPGDGGAALPSEEQLRAEPPTAAP
jgi:hypothetical protein